MRVRKSHLLALAVVVAAVAVVVAANVAAKAEKSGAPGGKGRGGGGTVVSVRTQTLKVETLHGYVTTNGEVESQNSVSVYPDASGKIMEMSVMLGSSVKRGDVLGYVDPNSPGSYYKRSPVYAPISGSVISTPLRNGTTVSTNTEICQIGDISNLQVSANVPERYVSVLKNGLKAKIFLEAYPDITFAATVSRVSPVVDSDSRTKQVILNFDSVDSRVNAGMFAKVVLYTEDYSGFVTMPSDSLVQNGDDYFVYVVRGDSTVEKRKVSLGKSVDGIVQILEGAAEGERVVVQGQTSLGDGSKILDLSDNFGKDPSEQENEKDRKSSQKNSKKGGN